MKDPILAVTILVVWMVAMVFWDVGFEGLGWAALGLIYGIVTYGIIKK